MTDKPLHLASKWEVFVRVTYHLIMRRTEKATLPEWQCFEPITALAYELDRAGLKDWGFWAIAYRVEWFELGDVWACRQSMLERCASGYNWRRIAYNAYKANRR